MNEDEWFFSSFNRYNELQMFDFPKVAREIDLTSARNLCVALSEDNSNRNEILIFFLPSTLQSKQSQNAKFDRHLSFDHGYFTESRLIQMRCLPTKEYLVISEENGVAIYDVDCKDSDMIKKISSIPCSISNSRMALNTDKYIAFCGPSSDRRLVVNFESMNTVLCIEEKDARNMVVPIFSSSDVISFGDTITGSVTSYDVRDGKQVHTITVPEILLASQTASTRWLFNSAFDIRRQPSNKLDLYLFSTNGNFLVYDSRKSSEPVVGAKHSLDCETFCTVGCVQMNISPANDNQFSVCGFDQNVYVCEVNGNGHAVDVIFTHDGHSYSEDEFEPNVRSVCSTWLPHVSPQTVVSCGSNSSVQCWQYKIS